MTAKLGFGVRMHRGGIFLLFCELSYLDFSSDWFSITSFGNSFILSGVSLWGFARRLSKAHVLVCGMKGAVAEVTFSC